jgi:cyclase
MARWLGGAVLVLVLAFAAGTIWLYQKIDTLETVQVTPDVHAILGLGGNVGVLRTEEGAVVVDTMTFRTQGAHIRRLAEDLGGGPVQAVIDTHYHRDHTHGNPGFAPGTKIVSTRKTLGYLRLLDGDYWKGDAAKTLPNETFQNQYQMRVGGKTLRLIHPGRGHTDGDLVVLFVEDKVLHTGDLFFNGRYPNIDLEAGGSVTEWVQTLDRLLDLDFDKVIPGHGPVTDRAGLRQFREFMSELARVGDEAVRQGWSLEQTEENAVLTADAGYEVIEIPFVMRLDREFVVRRAWEEATGNVDRVTLPEDVQ